MGKSMDSASGRRADLRPALGRGERPAGRDLFLAMIVVEELSAHWMVCGETNRERVLSAGKIS